MDDSRHGYSTWKWVEYHRNGYVIDKFMAYILSVYFVD